MPPKTIPTAAGAALLALLLACRPAPPAPDDTKGAGNTPPAPAASATVAPASAAGSAQSASAASDASAPTCSILSCSDTCPCVGHNQCQAGRCVRDPAWKIESLAVGGDSFACASYAGGQVWCAGENDLGQLGRGTDMASNPELLAQKIVGPGRISAFRNPTELALGDHHGCALWPGGVSCWGFGGGGELGSGAFASNPTPEIVPGLTDVKSIAAGKSHTCAITRTGSVQCWGANARGQLGDGTTEKRAAPVAVNGVKAAKQLALGDEHSCALKTDGSVACWGGPDGTVAHAVAGLGHVDEIAATARGACGRAGHAVMCWGSEFGAKPTPGPGLKGAVHLAGGADIICAIVESGEVFCTDAAGKGFYVTTEVENVHLKARLMGVGRHYACTVRTDEYLDCDVDLPAPLQAVIRQL